jgi:flagellar hook-length control protein FliK
VIAGAPALPLAEPAGEAAAAPQADDLVTLFLPLLQKTAAPPGGGGGEPPKAPGARTAQSEGADTTDTDAAGPVASLADPVATALLQVSLPVPPSGAPTHTDDAREHGAGAHDTRTLTVAAAGLAGGEPAAGPQVEMSQLPQDAAVDATRPAADPADGTAAHAQLGGTAAAGAAVLEPARVRGFADPVAVPLQNPAPRTATPQGKAAAAAPARSVPEHGQGRRRPQAPAVAAVRDALRAAAREPVAATDAAVSAADAATAPGSAPNHLAAAPTSTPTAHARLSELPRSAAAVLEVATAAKATRARIVLTPPQLGKVEIRLRYTSDGVSATFRADSPQAAQTLAGAASDLRRALETQGIPVARIEVPPAGAAASDQQASSWLGGGSASPGFQQSRGGGAGFPAAETASFDPDDQTTLRTVLLGTAVDVLA